MARVRGQRAEPIDNGPVAAAARAIGFTLLAGTALAILAAAALLPAWHRRDVALSRRDALLADSEARDRLIEYKQRLAESIQRDPLQTERLLIQQQNYHRPGEVAVTIKEAPADLTVADILAARAAQPSPPSPWLRRLARRLEQPRPRRGLMVVAGLLATCSIVLFLPPAAPPRRRR